MAITLINLGTVANDGTGDDLRDAFLKVNQNFEELDLRVPESTTASNKGAGEGIFASKVGYDLQFKSLVAGENVTFSATDNQITVNSTGGLQELIVVSDLGSKILADGDTLRIQGGNNASVEYNASLDRFIINSETVLSSDITPTLGSNLNADSFAINNLATVNTSDAQLGSNYLKTINGENLELSAEGGGQVVLLGNDLIVNQNIQVGNSIIGNLTGNVTGNVNGNLAGYHTGDMSGSVFADDSTVMIDSVSKTIYGTFVGDIIGDIDGDPSLTLTTPGTTANEAINLAPKGDVSAVNIIADEIKLFDTPITDEIYANAGIIGNLTGLVYGADVRRIFNDLDLGETVTDISNWADYLIYTSQIDLGSFTAPSGISLDLGEI